jgi:hypothetical protein
MYAVVNFLHFRDPIDEELFRRAANELRPQMEGIDGFAAFHVVRTSDTEAILVIVGDAPATLDRISTEVGSPWMVANVVPLLSGPPERHLGEIVASTQYL